MIPLKRCMGGFARCTFGGRAGERPPWLRHERAPDSCIRLIALTTTAKGLPGQQAEQDDREDSEGRHIHWRLKRAIDLGVEVVVAIRRIGSVDPPDTQEIDDQGEGGRHSHVGQHQQDSCDWTACRNAPPANFDRHGSTVRTSAQRRVGSEQLCGRGMVAQAVRVAQIRASVAAARATVAAARTLVQRTMAAE